VPVQTPTIQAAIDARVDTVLVLPGIYPESLTVRTGVLVAGKPQGPDDRPILLGVAIRPLPGLGGGGIRFESLAFSGRVHVINNDEHTSLSFSDCRLGAGIIDDSEYVATGSIALRGCSVTGDALLSVDGGDILVDSCKVAGSIAISGGSPSVEIRGSTFEGQGTGAAIGTLVEAVTCVIQGNYVRGYHQGIGVSGIDVEVSDNIIEICSHDGLVVQGGRAVIRNNMIRSCRAGILVDGWPAVVSGNRVDHCAAMGVLVTGRGLDLVENVAWGCGRDGFDINGSDFNAIRIVRNTSCDNAWSGFVSRETDQSLGSASIQGNIARGNGRYGLAWPAGSPASVTCNNWFANVLGEVENLPVSSLDFSVDPMFCNAEEGDFRLRAESPLANWPGCGLVGALLLGCGVTATLVREFSARRVEEGVRVRWEVGEGATASKVWLERSDGLDSEWLSPVTERSEDGGGVVELDRGALRDRSYWYRLVAMEDGAIVPLGQPKVVESFGVTPFELESVAPNPGKGPFRIPFSLARPAAIELEIFDVQGRGVALLVGGEWPAGRHEVEWNGLTRAGSTASAGWYLVRYRYPGGQLSQPLVRTR
jgi:hypothetical protein